MAKQETNLRSNTPFMSDTHPLNPYGSNYVEHDYETKLFYKFNQVKRHVHLDEADSQRMQKYSIYFYGGMAASALIPIISYKILQRFVKNEHFTFYGHYYLGIVTASLISFSYGYCTTLYIQNVARPLMYKYLDKAIQNGFQDYEISVKN